MVRTTLNNIKIIQLCSYFYIGYVTPNSVKPVYPIVNNANGYIEDSN